MTRNSKEIRLLLGNNQFLINLYNESYEKILNFARYESHQNPNIDADDVVQETFYRIYRHLENNPEQNIENPLAYLIQTAKNIIRENYRKRMYKENIVSLDENPHLGENIISSDSFSILEKLELEDKRKQLNMAITDLTELEKSILEMYIQGYNSSEISIRLDKDEYMIRYMLNAVKAKIRYRIKKMFKKMD